MKICPKCGYRDLEYWRQNKWRTNVEFTPISEFQIQKPDLAKRLVDGEAFVTDILYAYRLSGKGKTIVERVIMEEFKISSMKAFHIPTEHVDHKP